VAKDHLVYRERTSVAFEAPAGVQVGEAVFPASRRKRDPITGEEVEAFTGEPTFTFTAPVTVAPEAQAGAVRLTATVRYQGCSPKLCYLPMTKRIDIAFKVEGQALTPQPSLPRTGEGGMSSPLQDFSRGQEGLLAKGRVWALLLAFAGGVLTSLTPCVYPLIPITIGIFGARGARRLIERLTLSFIYVLGIAAMYSGLGLAAASTGAVFGQVMANPWVIGGVATVFALFGASMLGAFEMQLPAALQARLSQVGGRGYGGAFAMGLVGGIIAAPCTGPALGAVLTYVATTRDLAFGFWLLFAFALGMGVLFIVIGTFSGAMAALPRSGAWMEGVKSALGILMLAAALFFLKDVVPPLKEALGRSTEYFAGVAGLVAVGLLLGAVHRSFHDASTGVRLRKGLGVALCVAGVYLTAGAFTVTASVAGPEWVHDEAEGLAQARREGRPAMIDFYADWCAACVELDRYTYSDPRVRERLKGFVSIKVDFTEESEATRALQKKYRLVGLPTVLFFDGQGNELPHKRLTGFAPAGQFLAHIEDIR
jgi:thiol:disulfide interchange protein DsbD